jgi:DNA polymerase III gamma/tau subunit
MDKITKTENIKIEEDAISFILNISNNTVKVLINYMEKCKLLNEPITLDLAMKTCTNISLLTFEDYINRLKTKDLAKGIHLLYNLHDKGYSVMDILDNFFLFVKTSHLLSEDEKYAIFPIICKYISIFHNIHEDEIELALFTNNLYKIFN